MINRNSKRVFGLLLSAFLCSCAQTPERNNDFQAAGGIRYSVTPSADLLLDISLSDDSLESISTTQDSESANLIFSMSNMSSGGVMMSVKSKLDKPIKYDLYMVDNRGGHHYTSSCPVMPGSGAYESWGDNTTELLVGNIRVLNQEADFVCE